MSAGTALHGLVESACLARRSTRGILIATNATARRRNDAAPVSARDRDVRGLSNRPDATVYNGPKSKEDGPKRVTLRTIRDKYRNGVPLTMVTAYDYPSAVHVDNAGIDLILVGDSVGMVVHGHDTTQPVTMDDMVLHCRAVTRGVSRPFVIGDLPFGSYELGPRQAVRSAMRLVKEAQVDAVKLEGGGPRRVEAVAAIVEAGVAVMGHVGLNPQAISVLGGFRAMGRTAEEAARVVEEAQALEKAGCFAVVLECVPAVVGRLVTESLSVPTIGIGAGPSTSGQVLVYHDLLGMMQHPHHAKVTPKFCKAYGKVGEEINRALSSYREEVTSGAFPGEDFSPYKMEGGEEEKFAEYVRRAVKHTGT